VRLAADTLVELHDLSIGPLPRVAEASVPELNLVAWAADKGSLIEETLHTRGAMLFRGFRAPSAEEFERFVAGFSGSLIEYGERSSPRSQVAGRVYTSTDHPPDQRILQHNEQSYTLNWPMKIAFACVQPAAQGGSTPLADTRRILARLDPALVSRFSETGVMYVRNYDYGLGLPWNEVFQATDRREVEEHCRGAGIAFEWRDDNRLRTRQVRAAVRRHPRTGELLWFNHGAFFHASSMERSLHDSLRETLDESELPFNVYYGDGAAIEPDALDAIRTAYDAETVSFPWAAGDVLVLDNMLVCHGREAFSGPRRVLTAMAEPVTDLLAGELIDCIAPAA
jgi:alpha-ketoglutarate-dependent taurine dioxygenase